MRRLFVLTAALLVAAGALAPSAEAARGGTYRPFHGTGSGSSVFDFGNPKDCLAGFTTVGLLEGTSSHLGLASWKSAHCFVPGAPGEPGGVADADVTLTAANGDELTGTYTGVIEPGSGVIGETFEAELSVTVDGGTGRFTDATGNLEVTIVITFEGFGDLSWESHGSWTGTISY